MSSHSAASLYCGEDAGDVVSFNSDTWKSPPLISSSSSPSLSDQSPPSDESTIDRLIESESNHMPQSDYLRRCFDRSIDLTARQDSINWILKVHAHYQFRPVTAFLSINYFDRFLSSHSLPESGGWGFQLLSVACLSLAAKMEELSVPLLIDLQVFEPRFVFEPRTVQRMELWVMANLNWRLRSVTPFDYLHYFTSNLIPFSGSKPDFLITRILSSSSELILNTTRVLDFLAFPPSVIAAAAVLSAAGDSVKSPANADRLPAYFHDRINEEMVRSCHQLMEEYLIDTCQSAGAKDFTAEPPSPVAVLDAAACGSCETLSNNPVSGSGSSEEEPPNKRHRSSASDVQ